VTPATIRYPDDLPIVERREELLATIRDNQVVIVAGETGSGKSTQLPKFCLELGRGTDGWIGHTQPRRIAARAVAERISEELGTDLGKTVGYAVRFTDRVSDQTLVKVMTDGILLAEIQRDRDLSRYDTIIIDEAHERSLNIDFLLGYLHQLLPRRPELKVIITSATIDTQLFSAHFDEAPIVEVSGRTYPVEVRYRALDEGPNVDEPLDQPAGICAAAEELLTEGDGDILVFCSGEREISDAIDALEDLRLHETEIIPLFGRLSAAEQHRVFSGHSGRRIVVATNVAETSLTVPGIRYIVDAGTARISRYNRRTKVQRLPIEEISQASANQRAGRCGRLGPGVAIRLYSDTNFNERPEFTDPEILRTNLASVILQMASAGLGEVEDFPFVEPPDRAAIRDGVNLLDELGAVHPDHSEGGDRGLSLTRLGRRLARLPIDPRLGRMLLAGADNGCLNEMLVIAAGLSIQDPRERPTDKRDAADALHARFADDRSDFSSMLNLWNHLRDERTNSSSSRFRRMCRQEYINYPRVREWQDLHSQLRRVARDLKLSQNSEPADTEAVHLSLLAGLLSHVGTTDGVAEGGRRPSFEYRGARNSRFAIAPGSALFRKRPRWVMASELVETNRLWGRVVAPIAPEWIERLGEHLLKYSYSEPWWDEAQGAGVAHESATLYGLPIVNRRVVQWGRIDRADARDLFIHHALVEGEWDRAHAFIEHNRSVVEEAATLETRLRRSDLMVDIEHIADWFDQRIPGHVTSVGHFDRWWKKARVDQPGLLDLEVADVLRVEPAELDHDAFPEVWHHGDIEIALSYSNDPATSWDGLTIDIPIGALQRIDASVFEWQVPGFRAELVEALIRSLPKTVRKAFVPVPQTVAAIINDLRPEDGGLREVLRTALSHRADVAIAPDGFDDDKIPNHLRPSFRVVGDDDLVIAEGTDLDAIKELLADEIRATLAASEHELEQIGLTAWTFGELPRVVETHGPGHTVRAYPALVDEGDSVAIRLLATPEEQADAMWAGTRRLLLLGRSSVSKALRDLLTDDMKLALLHSPYDGPKEWFDDLLNASVDQLMLESDAPVWDATAFETLLTHLRGRLANVVGALGRASTGALSDLRSVRTHLETFTSPRFDPTVADVRSQLDRLVYPGFLTGLGADRLPDLRRYLQAIERRLDQLAENPRRDLEGLLRVRVLENELDTLAAQMPWTLAMEDVMWMCQELRVSLFAQALGAKGNISDKRIRRALAAIADPR
jgi:ATP-dependent helicase HrpA